VFCWDDGSFAGTQILKSDMWKWGTKIRAMIMSRQGVTNGNEEGN